MGPVLQQVWRDDSGQEFIEYTFLMAFICVISASLLLYSSDPVEGIVNRILQILDRAQQGGL